MTDGHLPIPLLPEIWQRHILPKLGPLALLRVSQVCRALKEWSDPLSSSRYYVQGLYREILRWAESSPLPRRDDNVLAVTRALELWRRWTPSFDTFCNLWCDMSSSPPKTTPGDLVEKMHWEKDQNDYEFSLWRSIQVDNIPISHFTFELVWHADCNDDHFSCTMSIEPLLLAMARHHQLLFKYKCTLLRVDSDGRYVFEQPESSIPAWILGMQGARRWHDKRENV